MKLVMRILGSDPEDAMEAAKEIIADSRKVPIEIVLEIAKAKTFRTWSRMCAIYVLGFTKQAKVESALMDQLLNEDNSYSLRGFAADALGNLQTKKAKPILQRLYNDTKNATLRKSCRYALSQM